MVVQLLYPQKHEGTTRTLPFRPHYSNVLLHGTAVQGLRMTGSEVTASHECWPGVVSLLLLSLSVQSSYSLWSWSCRGHTRSHSWGVREHTQSAGVWVSKGELCWWHLQHQSEPTEHLGGLFGLYFCKAEWKHPLTLSICLFSCSLKNTKTEYQINIIG